MPATTSSAAHAARWSLLMGSSSPLPYRSKRSGTFPRPPPAPNATGSRSPCSAPARYPPTHVNSRTFSDPQGSALRCTPLQSTRPQSSALYPHSPKRSDVSDVAKTVPMGFEIWTEMGSEPVTLSGFGPMARKAGPGRQREKRARAASARTCSRATDSATGCTGGPPGVAGAHRRKRAGRHRPGLRTRPRPATRGDLALAEL